MKSVIGLTPLYEEENRCLQMRADYMDAVQNAGGVPVILPLTDDSVVLQRAISLCSGILLTGGQDVDPELYGEHPLPECGKSVRTGTGQTGSFFNTQWNGICLCSESAGEHS